jgi:hypothetical protein
MSAEQSSDPSKEQRTGYPHDSNSHGSAKINKEFA